HTHKLPRPTGVGCGQRKGRPMNHPILAVSAMSIAFSLSVSAQSSSAQKSTSPMTPWDEPDLQGIYTNQTLTPLERPINLGTKAFYTKEEAQALETRANSQRELTDDAPPRSGDVGNYNAFWMEPGTKIVGSLQTSLVVDPPNGRVPLRREAEQRRDEYARQEADSFDFMSPC